MHHAQNDRMETGMLPDPSANQAQVSAAVGQEERDYQ